VVRRADRRPAGEDLLEAVLIVGAVRDLADRYLDELCVLDPIRATYLGVPGHDGELPDFSPTGATERVTLARRTLTALDQLDTGADDQADRRCRALLVDRLSVEVDQFDAGEHLRPLRVIGSPIGSIRSSFDLMATATDDDWMNVAARLEQVPGSYRTVQLALEQGSEQGVFAAPRQAHACATQLATWAGEGAATPWFDRFVASAPESMRRRLDHGAAMATATLAELAAWLREVYAPAAAGTPDGVGPDRYALGMRQFLGSRADPGEAYAWAWDELGRIEDEMTMLAEVIAPGASVYEAMDHLDAAGEAIEGEAALQRWLQDLMDETVAALDGTHFDLAPPLRTVEAMIAPPGSAAAQYYTAPTADFSRPGRTWYPTMGKTRFPIWNEVSTCYHEGVPGHHLQLAQWVYVAQELSRFQGSTYVSANIEGWALYAERLMDELGFLADPGRRLGYLVAQQLRAARVVVDIGMHLSLVIPGGQPFHPGERWTPELGREFLALHAGTDIEFLDSEWTRYLGWPAQAISYKLGERVWLAGRAEAQRRAAASGNAFDQRAWHMAALSMGSVGLDDLAAELPRLPQLPPLFGTLP
jgi:uncharacterized protein (DUF885 family)